MRRPLSGRILDPGGVPDFVVAEWSDDGGTPGELIAPPHVHVEEDEAWVVLKGQLGFRLGDDQVIADAGTAVFGPRGLAHTYWNPGPGEATYLLVMGPRTCRLIAEMHDGAQRDARALRRLFLRYGVTLL